MSSLLFKSVNVPNINPIKPHRDRTESDDILLIQPDTATTPGCESNGEYKGECKEHEILPFPSPITLQNIQRLRIGDKIDHRNLVGRFCKATIIEKQGTSFKIHYDGWSDKWDTWTVYQLQERFRFTPIGSISKRPAHRLTELKVNDLVDINPLWKHPGWKYGRIRKFDTKSRGQIQVSYQCDDVEYRYWTHLDNELEIAEYRTRARVSRAMQDKEGKLELSDTIDSLQTIALTEDTAKLLAALNEERRRNLELKKRVKMMEDEKQERLQEIRTLKDKNKRLMIRSIDESEYERWNSEEISLWITGLDRGRFVKYEETLNRNLMEEEVDGALLEVVDGVDLKRWGITKLADNKYLQKRIEELLSRHKTQDESKRRSTSSQCITNREGTKFATSYLVKSNDIEGVSDASTHFV